MLLADMIGAPFPPLSRPWRFHRATVHRTISLLPRLCVLTWKPGVEDAQVAVGEVAVFDPYHSGYLGEVDGAKKRTPPGPP